MESWQTVLGGFFAGALLAGMVREKFFSKPAKDEAEMKNMRGEIATLKSEIAVIQATKLTETQVRNIVHEQIQPMMVSINEILKDQKRQGDLLARIDERLEKQEKA